MLSLFVAYRLDQVGVSESRGAKVTGERHAPPGAVEEGDADVEDALGTAGGAADLERQESRFGEPPLLRRLRRRREQARDGDADGADHGNAASPSRRADLDPDGGRLAVEEVAVDAERELLVPLRVGLPGLAGLGLQSGSD